MGFKNKSKKVFKKRSCKDRIKNKKNKKRNTRKRTNTNIRGGVKGKQVILTDEEVRLQAAQKASLKEKERNDRLIKRNIKTTPIIKLERANAIPRNSHFISKLPNTKLTRQKSFIDALCYADGPDRGFIKELHALQQHFANQANQRGEFWIQFKKLQEDIQQRQGLIRCEAGRYTSVDFPASTNTTFRPLNTRLKFVVVKDKDTGSDRILVTEAYRENYNYAGENILKWTDTNDMTGIVSIRSTPKNVIIINSSLMQKIEDYGRYTLQKKYPWDSLLMAKIEAPEMYKEVIESYFLNTGMTVEQIKNTVFIRSINEISHSSIPYMYPNWENLIETDLQGRPVVYLGAEGVFYKKLGDNQLYFVICNLSGHYKTPPELMTTLKKTLETTYKYANVELLVPPPPTPPSSMESDDDEQYPDYKRILTNDRSITTFIEALAILDAADTSTVQGLISRAISKL